jgi:phosphoenolpyruvate-protein phosphotransferase
MGEVVLRGLPAAPGLAAGAVWRRDGLGTADEPVVDVAAEVARALSALEETAVELESLATSLLQRGSRQEAEIIETGALMARDPSFQEAVAGAVRERRVSAPAALQQAARAFATTIAALDDPTLAARADDVISVGARASRRAAGAESLRCPTSDVVMVASNLGPADVAELPPNVLGFALAEGGTTAHAAIVARSLGVPMVVGIGPELLALRDGAVVVVDGDAGTVAPSPEPALVDRARALRAEERSARAAAAASSALPAVTRDGRRVRVLANVASAGEVALALESGAEGAGLIRTELGFLEATGWPAEADHRRLLAPILSALGRRLATVRLLDFGGDKTPPFLAGTPERGIRLLLSQPDALDAQLKAIVAAAGDCELRVLLPMVTEADQVVEVRRRLRRLTERPISLGAMVEVPAAAAIAPTLAPIVDFFSVGTNDLTQFTLGVDRLRPGQAAAHHPAVLRLISLTVEAARKARIPVDVCGEAGSDPVAMPLLLGLGVDELSVGAARVGRVRAWVRRLEQSRLESLTAAAVEAGSADAVEALAESVRPLLDQARDADG